MSHRAIASALVANWHYSSLGEDERLIGLPPLYHIYGFANVFMLAPAFGASVSLIQKVCDGFAPKVHVPAD